MRLSDFENDFYSALNGYRLTTAEITYHLPDYPALLQTYLWQDFDFPPQFPRLSAFLEFWRINIDGKIELVKIMTADSLKSHSFKLPTASFEIH